MSLVVTGIGELSTLTDPDDDVSGADHHEGLGQLHDAAVVLDDTGRVEWVGPSASAPQADRQIDVAGRAVVPAFVDTHTHLVFAGERSREFAARMAGTPYDGGGIATTVAATAAASDDELRTLLAGRVAELRAQGTGTIEVKSGYGLDVEAETRLLRLAAEVTTEVTFLGAHVVPPAYAGRRADYVDLVTGPMLTAATPWARWVDVFCEPGSAHAFDGDEARTVLEAGRAAGLGLRVHGNQLGPGPGVRLAVELGAASVDHCTHLAPADVDALAGAAASTVATLLPGVEFSTRSPYPDARALLDAGATVAVATDCNPGTCYSSSMPFVIALTVRELRLTPAEALRAATAGAAAALRRRDVGRIRVGARPGLTLVDAPSHTHLAYRPGVPLARLIDASLPSLARPAGDPRVNGEASDRIGIVRFADRPAVPWRNGHGSTRELAKRLLGVRGPDFVWRISVAEVTEDAEFSTFPGVERTVVPIWGSTLGMEVAGVHTEVGLFETFTFPGEAQTFVQPHGGASRVLNVMTQTSRMVATVRVVDLASGPVSIAGATSWVQLTGSATATESRGDTADLLPLDALVPRQRVRLVHGTGLAAVVAMTNYRAFHDAG